MAAMVHVGLEIQNILELRLEDAQLLVQVQQSENP